MTDDFRYSIDLSMAERRANKIIDCVKDLRARYNLTRYEFTRTLRVAPTEIPHSHPVLTLNTQLFDPDEILCEYLHEQMHWYLVQLRCSGPESPVIADLKGLFPQVPQAFPEAAQDEYSTYLHLLVNWLEIEVAAQFLPQERVHDIAQRKSYYRWIYRTVLANRANLGILYAKHGIVPIRPTDARP